MTARKHHWISQGYLRGFVRAPVKTQIYTYDFKLKRSFTTNTANVAAERDFNAIDADGVPKDALENALAQIESAAIDAIRDVAKAPQKIADHSSRDVILNLMCLLAIRNPRLRDAHRKISTLILPNLLKNRLSTRVSYEREMQALVDQGDLKPQDVLPFDKFTDMMRDVEFPAELQQSHFLQTEFLTYLISFSSFLEREWVTLIAPPDAGTFITCDHPVLMRPLRTGKRKFGFSDPDVAILIPLTQSLFLVGKQTINASSYNISPIQIAELNTEVLMSAERQIYAPSAQFEVYDDQEGRCVSGHQKLVLDKLHLSRIEHQGERLIPFLGSL